MDWKGQAETILDVHFTCSGKEYNDYCYFASKIHSQRPVISGCFRSWNTVKLHTHISDLGSISRVKWKTSQVGERSLALDSVRVVGS